MFSRMVIISLGVEETRAGLAKHEIAAVDEVLSHVLCPECVADPPKFLLCTFQVFSGFVLHQIKNPGRLNYKGISMDEELRPYSGTRNQLLCHLFTSCQGVSSG